MMPFLLKQTGSTTTRGAKRKMHLQDGYSGHLPLLNRVTAKHPVSSQNCPRLLIQRDYRMAMTTTLLRHHVHDAASHRAEARGGREHELSTTGFPFLMAA